MDYEVIKLHFKSRVHFGDGRLDDSNFTLPAHTVFSALCQEALLIEGEAGINRLVAAVNEGNLRLSDALPFIVDEYYLPKPMLRLKSQNNADNDPNAGKKFKKLKYIPLSSFNKFCRGEFEVEDVDKAIKDFGKSSLRTCLSSAGRYVVNKDPYFIGLFEFVPEAGLYIIIQGHNEMLAEIKNLFASLGFSGIGGKTSSGLGRFEAEFVHDNFPLTANSAPLMTLSACMADENELSDELIYGASYILQRAGGFVASASYASDARRKRDFYDFAAGSVFQKPFQGKVFDVSSGGKHPVWHYAAPLWLGVST